MRLFLSPPSSLVSKVVLLGQTGQENQQPHCLVVGDPLDLECELKTQAPGSNSKSSKLERKDRTQREHLQL